MTEHPTDAMKPCPFCGHPGGVLISRDGMSLARVQCLGCSAEGPAKDHDEGAIAAWNTRTTPIDDEVLNNCIDAVHTAMRPYPETLPVGAAHRISVMVLEASGRFSESEIGAILEGEEP